MGELVFIGLGLNEETDISLKGLQKTKEAETVFAEFYTSLMPQLNLDKLQALIGKRINIIRRHDLEEEEGKKILEAAKNGKAVLLTPGDPLIATTHVDLRIRAEKNGIKTSIIHGPSIVSAVVGLSGLQNYKLGRSVTIPFSEGSTIDATPYNVVAENQKDGLHTLCFLDVRAEERRYMTIREALEVLSSLEEQKQRYVVANNTLVVGVARAGSENPIVKADFFGKLQEYDFGSPPHTLVFPGRLHFMEAEALITLAKAPRKIAEMAK